jgi:hypothetical protein
VDPARAAALVGLPLRRDSAGPLTTTLVPLMNGGDPAGSSGSAAPQGVTFPRTSLRRSDVVDPRLYVDVAAGTSSGTGASDTDAEALPPIRVLGRYADGGRVSAASRRFASHTAAFSGAPGVPAELLRFLAEEAGAVPVAELGTVVHARANCALVLPGPLSNAARVVTLPPATAAAAAAAAAGGSKGVGGGGRGVELVEHTFEDGAHATVRCVNCSTVQAAAFEPGEPRLYCLRAL